VVAQYPGSSNVFVKDHNASKQMVVDFSRSPSDFAVNTYCQIVPVTKVAGYYLEMTVEEAGRLLTSDGAEFLWPDNADAPEDMDGTESFEWKQFKTQRRKFGFRLGDLTVDQASWEIVAQHSAIKAQQAMTARTALAIAELTNTSNYAAAHTSAVSSISGNTGTWAASTTARSDIKRSLNYAGEIILKDTLSAIDLDDLVLVMSPTTARNISESQELIDHVKGSPEALAQVRGEMPGRNAIFGLPDKIYGFPVVIEKTVKVTSKKGATKATSFVQDSGKPFLAARPGGLEGLYGAPSFATCTIFIQEEMTVETKHDTDNRLMRGRVVENYDVVMTAPVSGFLFTGAV
jgi:hypothetical protein